MDLQDEQDKIAELKSVHPYIPLELQFAQ
jgi:hypothetical protein